MKRLVLFPFILLIVVTGWCVVNVTQVPGATEIIFYLRNYLYADAVSGQPLGTLNLFTGINQLGYKDFLGNMHKVLNDASAGNVTPEKHVFFADSSGAAQNDYGFYYDSVGNDLYVDSNAVHHAGSATMYITNGAHIGEVHIDPAGVLSLISDYDTLITFTDEAL